MKTSWK